MTCALDQPVFWTQTSRWEFNNLIEDSQLTKRGKRGNRNLVNGGANVTREWKISQPGKSVLISFRPMPFVCGFVGFQTKSYQRMEPLGIKTRNISEAISILTLGSRIDENAVSCRSKSKVPFLNGRYCPLAFNQEQLIRSTDACSRRSRSKSIPTSWAGFAPNWMNSLITPPEPQPISRICASYKSSFRFAFRSSRILLWRSEIIHWCAGFSDE